MEKITFPYFITWRDKNNSPCFGLDIHRTEFSNGYYFYNIDYSIPGIDLDLHPKIKTLDRVLKNYLWNDNFMPFSRLVRQICLEVTIDPVLKKIGLPDEFIHENEINWELLEQSSNDDEDEDKSYNCKWARYADRMIRLNYPFKAYRSEENNYLYRALNYFTGCSYFNNKPVDKTIFLSLLSTEEIFEIADIINDIYRVELVESDLCFFEDPEDRIYIIYDIHNIKIAIVVIEEKTFIERGIN